MDIITINGFDFYSYATVAQADEYFSAKFGSEWANIDEEDKKKLLVTATREIENLCFQGIKIDKEQPLKFPRKICCLEIEADNPKIITCCAEIANAFYNTGDGDTVTPNADKIKSMSVGDTSITYKDGATISVDSFTAIAKSIASKYLGCWLCGNIKVIL